MIICPVGEAGMSDISYVQTIEQRDRRDRAIRMKLGVSMLTTFGYSTMGTALIEPVLKSGKFTIVNLSFIALSTILFFTALYIAPQGEAS
jgi:hypothetical protein